MINRMRLKRGLAAIGLAVGLLALMGAATVGEPATPGVQSPVAAQALTTPQAPIAMQSLTVDQALPGVAWPACDSLTWPTPTPGPTPEICSGCIPRAYLPMILNNHPITPHIVARAQNTLCTPEPVTLCQARPDAPGVCSDCQETAGYTAWITAAGDYYGVCVLPGDNVWGAVADQPGSLVYADQDVQYRWPAWPSGKRQASFAVLSCRDGWAQREVEVNDVPISANAIGSCRLVGNIWPAGDVDWYRITAPLPKRIRLDLQLPPGDANYDLSLYPAQADWPLAQSTNPGGQDEQIIYTLPAAGTYYVLVSSFLGQSEQNYTLTLTLLETEPVVATPTPRPPTVTPRPPTPTPQVTPTAGPDDPHWERRGLDGETVYQLAACGEKLYAATGHGVFRSGDAGATWMTTTVHVLSRGVAANPADCDTVYAAAWGRGVMKSNDGGSVWSSAGLLPVTHVYAVGVDPVLSRTVYVGLAYTGVWSSTNSGDSWRQTGLKGVTTPGLSLSGRLSETRLFAATWGDGVYETSDQGRTWTSLGAVGDGRFYAVAAQAQTRLLAGESGLYCSEGGGWTQAAAGVSFSALISGSVHYAGTAAGALRGSGCNLTPYGLDDLSVRGLATLGAFLYAGTSDGVWRATP